MSALFGLIIQNRHSDPYALSIKIYQTYYKCLSPKCHSGSCPGPIQAEGELVWNLFLSIPD